MNRLTDIYLGNTHSQIVYDALSRMTSKQADGQTVFANADFTGVSGQPVRPHAMKSAETAEGVFPTASQTITYTSFDKVKSIAEGGNTLAYTYGFDQQRIRMVEETDGLTRTKDYVGVCEYITEDDGENTSEKTLTYLVGPYGVFAVVEQQDNEESMHYILKDHLGSWTTITDSQGNVEQELSFDAWGNMRDPETWCVDASMRPMFDRGYTGHEHLNGFGLINMNGRMYDPVMSSFLSVDRYVQQPDNSQGFNRYAYCMYNPLKYVDLSGWGMTLPEGLGVLPPPDGDEIDIFPTGVYTDTGFSSEYNSYTYNYGLSEVEVTPYGTWAEQRCKELVWEQNCGGLSAEYSGGEVNVPILSGGGGGGIFWTNYTGSPSKDNGIASNSVSYGISYAGLVTGFKKDLWEKPRSRAQKAINQKKAYNTQKALKAKGITKSVKEIRAGKITNLKTGGNVLGAIGFGLSGYDIIQSGEINVSNGYNLVIAGLCLLPSGWIIGGVALTLDLAFYGFTGESFGDNLSHWFGDPSKEFRK